MKRLLIGILIFILVISALILSALHLKKSEEQTKNFISGIAETRHIDVASKIPGRIDSLFVNEGDFVDKNSRLLTIESKEIAAKVEQARGAMLAANAKKLMVQNGLRPQELEAAMKLYLQAKAQYDLMEKTFTRVQRLYNDSVISSQEKDQIETQYISSKEQMEAARVKYELAKEGARTEERDAAQSLYYQAQNVYEEVLSYADERTVTSPVSGEIEKIISDPGEVISAGFPVITIIDTSKIWVIVQIKETLMSRFKKGAEFKGTIPALNDTTCDFIVHYITPMADFATWRPTNQKGEFDIRTFEIHLEPTHKIDGFRAGMTVNIYL